MSTLLYQLLDEVDRVWGNTRDPRLDAVRTINEAGRHLFSMHDWQWAVRAGVSLTLVPGQSHVALPDDFAQLVSLVAASGTAMPVVYLTSIADLYERRSLNTLDLSTGYWAAVVNEDQPDSESAVPAPRLELHPTPSDAEESALLLSYRSQWRELSTDRQTPNVPKAYHGLLVSLVRAFAQQALLPGSDAVERVEAAMSTLRLKENDGMQQAYAGPLLNGAIESANPTRRHNFVFTGLS